MALPVKPITYGLLALGFVSWIVFLAGNASLHKRFADLPEESYRSGRGYFLHSLLGYSWWSTWMMFVLLMATLAATAAGKLRPASRVLGLMATASFTMSSWVCDSTTIYETLNNSLILPEDLEVKFDVWLAGSIMVTATSALLLLWMGSLEMLTDPPQKDVAITAAQYAGSSSAVGLPSPDAPVSVQMPTAAPPR